MALESRGIGLGCRYLKYVGCGNTYLYLGEKYFHGQTRFMTMGKTLILITFEKLQIKSKLEELQRNLENREVTIQSQKEDVNLQCRYQNVWRKEEKFQHLKSCSLWLQ
jgi:hypothetical protein